MLMSEDDGMKWDVNRVGDDFLEAGRICLTLRTEHNGQVFVVILCTATDFQCLLQYFAIIDQDTTLVCQWYTVNRKFGTFLVGSIHDREGEIATFGCF